MPVGTRVNNPRNDYPKCVEPAEGYRPGNRARLLRLPTATLATRPRRAKKLERKT